MKSIEEIKNLTEEELSSYRDHVLAALNFENGNLPLSVFKALQSTKKISNSMFCILLNYITSDLLTFNSVKFGSLSVWAEDEILKGWCLAPLKNNQALVFLLDEKQFDILIQIDALDKTNGKEFREGVAKCLDGVLTPDSLTEEEVENELSKKLLIPENSGTVEFSDFTARFSGATWFEEIQKKTIILAGLGGIGSYVCFLLARMQPTSLFIYDDDTVEAVNMSGQLYNNEDIGKLKVQAMVEMVKNYANYKSVFAVPEKYENSTQAHDIMICGFDNMGARRIFYNNWSNHVMSKSEEERKHCLFIDGRLSADYLQVYAFTGDDERSRTEYFEKALFSDYDADETICSFKQTTYMANMIGSIIVNIFTNFVANEVAGVPISEVPYLTTFDSNSMQFKIK